MLLAWADISTYRDVTRGTGETLARRYQRTMPRLEQITQAVYQVKCNGYVNSTRGSQQPPRAENTSHCTTQSAEHWRCSLRGPYRGYAAPSQGRKRADLTECDVMSLYPYVFKYFKFQIGHPVYHVGDACQNMQATLLKDGLIKCSILRPRHLYHPVLPFRCKKQQLLYLRRTCAIDQNRTEDCKNETVVERALRGTWVLEGIRLAVKKGYKLVEVHEVYGYQVTQYDPETGNKCLFVQYIFTFLKLKAEASEYPSWIQSLSDEDR